MSHGLTTAQTARVAEGLRWVSARLFEILGTWAGEADHPSVAVSLATASRHLGWHIDDLAQLVPDAVLVAPVGDNGEAADPERDVAEPLARYPALDAALDAIRAIPGSTERLAVASRVLLPRLAAKCVAVERAAAPHADAPLTRVVGFLLSDVRRDRDDAELLLERLLVDDDTVDRAGARVVEAERRIVAAGGLLPARLDA